MNEFQIRGKEVSRVEALADAIFALAITLIIVSVEVPRDYDALLGVVKAFPVFAVCFGMLAWIWFKHYTFFRRYGLQDTTTITLNCILLFIILFYVYPLKYIFTKFLQSLTTRGLFDESEVRGVYIIYAVGFIAVFVTFALLHVHALRRRAFLKLTSIEIFDTKADIVDNLALASIGGTSLLLALVLPRHQLAYPGWSYFLTGIVKFAHGTVSGMMRNRYTA